MKTLSLLGFLSRSSLRPLLTRCRNVRTSQFRSATTHFGNEQVDEAEKEKRVHHVFANVANKYDMMNDAMSLGIHRLWKDYYVGGLPLGPNSKIIDVAGGTGDIAFRLQKRISAGGKVTVVDINQNMLDVGQERAKNDPQVVREAFRVLKPGGLLAVLEFSAINPLLRPLYDAYSFNVIPVMGQVRV
ncbi:ubiquinone/menaquinone biosynthesis methyltransferase [Ancylostoma caninum]|uniref:Ubiquinone/menaquinone biosynthesis methyltransferase n=1 Tax=Ancylostoma caninum TaxID=29170 RepID=A0A368FJ48_ANCCA|nr:ubiquinone/menaquinone biosynthesis methyltransferase [Ancylostoma caninum]